ncbi:SurA N-terminal domain-containing protein [Candidatus Fonsibacter ubiquis]|uniref:SurA N-terminal domain-containing protein n=1 Tax=Candidatus Fonsibacter ubiquis TaxID=1925548 RepID=UPI000C084178|nr:SurA N-terminal domain-containing protein [Candidatus Fonsibacter ubiquis]
MLSSLRKFSETLTAKIFIALIALSFVFWGINDFYKSSYNNAIAEINGDEISFNEFTKEYSKIIRNNNIQSQKLAIEKNIHIIAISNIISEKLLKIHTKNLGILTDDTVIAIEIKNNNEFKDKEIFSRTKYEKFLLERNINSKILEEEIDRNLKRKIITNSLNGYIPNSKKISETVLSTKINILYEDFLRKKYKIIINEKQLNSYLKNF